MRLLRLPLHACCEVLDKPSSCTIAAALWSCDIAAPHAGGLKALVGDAEELRKAVEFGTACGAFVTQVCSATTCHIGVTHAGQSHEDTAHKRNMTCMLTSTLTLQGPGAIEPQPTEADIAQFLGKNWDFETPPAEYFDLRT